MLWIGFTSFVELRSSVGVITCVLTAAGIFAAYGGVLVVSVWDPKSGIDWKDFIGTLCGGAAYGLTYWAIGLKLKEHLAIERRDQ